MGWGDTTVERDFEMILSSVEKLAPENVNTDKAKIKASIKSLMTKLKTALDEIGFRK